MSVVLRSWAGVENRLVLSPLSERSEPLNALASVGNVPDAQPQPSSAGLVLDPDFHAVATALLARPDTLLSRRLLPYRSLARVSAHRPVSLSVEYGVQ